MLAESLMNRLLVGLFGSAVALVATRSAFAQSPAAYENRSVRFANPSSLGYGGYSHYHSSTVAEGFLRGKAAVIDALGNFEVNDAQAGILHEQARALVRQNNLKQTEALVLQKKMWDDARVQTRKNRDARLVEGQQVLAQRRATVYRTAYQLPASELDLTTGSISWPVALRDTRFEANRMRLEELFRQHVGYGMSQADRAQEIARNVEQWSHDLRNQVSLMSREDFLSAQKFLMGLKYGAAAVLVAS